MKRLLLLIIRAYQWILSPVLGTHCRFVPSCSCYASEALQSHGALRGSWLTIKRLARCHPFSASTFDPVPAVKVSDTLFTYPQDKGGCLTP